DVCEMDFNSSAASTGLLPLALGLVARRHGPCGELLAELLKVPFVYTLRFTPGYEFEKHTGKLPVPPSYAPVVLSELSDRMTFMERFLCPLLPNFEFVENSTANLPNPCLRDSGIVFTLISMISDMPEDKAVVIASALAHIPQKRPDTLGANTQLYKWIPQNDLLGHPKTKAFITHGGTNGIYETIYHVVPMVGIPVSADQPDNVAHLMAKGAAVRVDFKTMPTMDLVNALKKVFNDP
ncbi:UDP-glucuronosyltransferase 2B18, partial [Galemys pyrenaicus]